MAFFSKLATTAMAVTSATLPLMAHAQRPMENLGRGIVAVRASDDEVLVSWRLLGLDDEDIGFNVYRGSDGGDGEKINDEVLTNGTNFMDSSADIETDNVYHVRAVIGGEEGDSSGSFTLPSDNAQEPVVRVPIEDSGSIKYVWVGDLDGDGEYDFIVDRSGDTQSIEAYLNNGTLLWEVDLGPNSENQDNIEPGSTAISIGNWDGVTVYDLDSDGKAEVAIRIANGVTFGDGETFEHDNDTAQFMAILDGQTGALRSNSQIPDDFIDDGPLAARFGVGYLDGETPHLVAFLKNRQPDQGDFNAMFTAWTFDGEEISMAWKWLRDPDGPSDGHNTRIIDADGDGVDEVHEIGFALNGDGTLKFSLQEAGIGHGDRFHIAKMDPDRDGLQGYGVQQDHPEFLKDYYYAATNGTLIWEHFGDENVDVGRGMVGDIDPNHAGMEVWAFDGVYNAIENELTVSDAENAPWPHLGIFWDGDELLELFNDGKFEKWNTESEDVHRIFRVSDYGGIQPDDKNPAFHGDILGDWREEVIVVNEDHTELLIFTTDQPTDIRLYTLAHNPAYRNSMTLKGYVQSHHVDYFIGNDMSAPVKPDITYAGA